MCSPSSRAAQRKYNASEHGKQARKAGNRTANVKFTKSNNVSVLRHAQSDTVNLMEIVHTQGYEMTVNGRKTYIQKDGSSDWKINLYGMIVQHFDKLSEAKAFVENELSDFMNRNSSAVESAERKYNALLKNNNTMTFKEYTKIK